MSNDGILLEPNDEVEPCITRMKVSYPRERFRNMGFLLMDFSKHGIGYGRAGEGFLKDNGD